MLVVKISNLTFDIKSLSSSYLQISVLFPISCFLAKTRMFSLVTFPNTLTGNGDCQPMNAGCAWNQWLNHDAETVPPRKYTICSECEHIL